MKAGYIEDPTIKATMPDNLLSAIGNTHVNLEFIVGRLERLLSDISGGIDDQSDPEQKISVLGVARENAKLTWRALELLDCIEMAFGKLIVEVDEDTGKETLISMGGK